MTSRSEIRIDEPDAGAVEAGVADHRKLGLQRPLRCIRPPPLHRPERLQDAKLLRHRLRGLLRDGIAAAPHRDAIGWCCRR